jgi:hypothetical protein
VDTRSMLGGGFILGFDYLKDDFVIRRINHAITLVESDGMYADVVDVLTRSARFRAKGFIQNSMNWARAAELLDEVLRRSNLPGDVRAAICDAVHVLRENNPFGIDIERAQRLFQESKESQAARRELIARIGAVFEAIVCVSAGPSESLYVEAPPSAYVRAMLSPARELLWCGPVPMLPEDHTRLGEWLARARDAADLPSPVAAALEEAARAHREFQASFEIPATQ